MSNKQKSNWISVLISIIVLSVLIIYSNVAKEKSGMPQNIFNKIVSPFQNLAIFVKEKIDGNEQYFADIKKMQDTIDELQKENSQLSQEVREVENLKTKNKELEEILNLSEKYSEYKTIPANVIARDISNYSKTIVINVGTKDGIQKNMTVIGDKGLVGYVSEVSDNTSKIVPITDSISSVSCIMSTTKDAFICKGQTEKTNELKATYLPLSANIFSGDSVETSGIGGIYPKGIHVGTIKKIITTSNVIDKYAIVETAVDFEKLDTVLVIRN